MTRFFWRCLYRLQILSLTNRVFWPLMFYHVYLAAGEYKLASLCPCFDPCGKLSNRYETGKTQHPIELSTLCQVYALQRPKKEKSIQLNRSLDQIKSCHLSILVSLALLCVTGPWFIGEVIDGHIGVCAAWGLYVEGVWIPGTLTYLYALLHVRTLVSLFVALPQLGGRGNWS